MQTFISTLNDLNFNTIIQIKIIDQNFDQFLIPLLKVMIDTILGATGFRRPI